MTKKWLMMEENTKWVWSSEIQIKKVEREKSELVKRKKKSVVTLWVKWGLRNDHEFSHVGKTGDHEMINFIAKVWIRAWLEKLRNSWKRGIGESEINNFSKESCWITKK